MKTALAGFLPVLLFCTLTKFAAGGDFQSVVLSATINPSVTITVPNGRFLVIRNFTQVGGTTRGEVMATLLSGVNPTVNVLDAALLDPTMSPEVINNVVVAGPASVSATCPDLAATCFLTYRKGDD
jgi:hypothetical protein